jgi:hypothetical protein
MLAIKGHFDGKVIVPDEPLDLPANQRVVVHIEAVEGKVAGALDWIADHAVDDLAIPADLAHQHDHYLYGTPKKP